jgi:threonyl-tRNA synthetase
MVHRALYGSIERFFGVLIEHYAGAFPVWLSPVQVAMIPISERHADYANKVAAQLKAIGVRVEVDARNEKMNAKIREHALQKVPFLLVVGDKEAEAGKVNVRTRGKEKTEDSPPPTSENSHADRGKNRRCRHMNQRWARRPRPSAGREAISPSANRPLE